MYHKNEWLADLSAIRAHIWRMKMFWLCVWGPVSCDKIINTEKWSNTIKKTRTCNCNKVTYFQIAAKDHKAIEICCCSLKLSMQYNTIQFNRFHTCYSISPAVKQFSPTWVHCVIPLPKNLHLLFRSYSNLFQNLKCGMQI
jgi:hypothetical protein